MPTCKHPLRVGLRFLAWRRVALRVGFAMALGATLVLPARLEPSMGQPEDLAAKVAPCPEPQEEVTADVGSSDGGIARGNKLPERFPDEWMKAPCPEGQNMRTVRGRCFIATGQKPPCSMGHENDGECLLALTGAKQTPNSIQH